MGVSIVSKVRQQRAAVRKLFFLALVLVASCLAFEQFFHGTLYLPTQYICPLVHNSTAIETVNATKCVCTEDCCSGSKKDEADVETMRSPPAPKEPQVTLLRGEHDTQHLKISNRVNMDVNNEIALKPDFVQTEFDGQIIELQNNGFVVLHQTWKDDCVLESKLEHMKSWEENEEKIRIVFWNDTTMNEWVEQRFEGDIIQTWKILESAQGSHIKKADLFRTLLIWYYGGIYADLDIKLIKSFREFLKEKTTLVIWEPEESMIQWTEFREGHLRKTLMLSGFLLSGQRFSDFISFYINWVSKNHVTGRTGRHEYVLSATGPKVEAEAYYYYTERIDRHDRYLSVLTYPQFLNYAQHFSATTWLPGSTDGIGCVDVDTVYSNDTLIHGIPT